jgi:DNA-directed RNA polymerase subunit B'
MVATKIYLDGKLIGFHDKPLDLITGMKKERRKGKLNSMINVGYKEDTDEVYINTTAGRIQRPLIVVENGKSLLTQEHLKQIREEKLKFNDLVTQGIIEYIDTDEEDNILVATNENKLTKKTTHLEVDLTSLFGVVVSAIPYVQHDNTGKSLLGAKVFKQAIGYGASNVNLKTETEFYQLYYPQKNIVKTKFMDVLKMDERPLVQNFVVVVLPYYGYNIEDSVVLNKASVERGLGRVSCYKTYAAKEVNYPGGQKDLFRIPDEKVEGFLGEDAYTIIGEDCLPELEQYVDKTVALIARVSPPKFLEDITDFGLIEEKYVDSSMFIKKNREGYVDRVFIMSEGELKSIKVKVRSEKVPMIGDKFSTKHGQKGVVGLLADEKDLPVGSNGTLPDLILNPHSIPSRMTVGDLIELMAGKVGSLSAESIDGTPFSGVPVEDLKTRLGELGFRPDGYETFYDGITGRKLVGEVYSGVIAYQRLYHMVKHKVQARARGPVQVMTRQPTEGKEKEGGLKFGEMETDCLIDYGAAMLLNEKLVDDSDKIKIPVCRECGHIAIEDKFQKRKYCVACNGTEITYVTMPYSFKLFLDELKAMAIFPKLSVEE